MTLRRSITERGVSEEKLVKRSPSPRPSPPGRGGIVFHLFAKPIALGSRMPLNESLEGSDWNKIVQSFHNRDLLSLSPGERAGVRASVNPIPPDIAKHRWDR